MAGLARPQPQHQFVQPYLDSVPEEIISRMLVYLASDFKSLARLSCASRWSLRAADDKLWHAMFLDRWAAPVSLAVSPHILDRGQRRPSAIAGVPWKTLFRDRSALAGFRTPHRLHAVKLKGKHRDAVFDICVDAYSIVTAGTDGKVKIWDRATRTCVRTLRTSSRGVTSVACHGWTIVCGTRYHAVQIWDARTGELQDTLRFVNRFVDLVYDNVDFVDVNDEIVVASAGGEVNVWSRSTRALIKTFTGRAAATVDVHDGLVAFAVAFNTVSVLNLPSGDLTYSQQCDNAVKWIQLESSILAVATGKAVGAWDIQSGKCFFLDACTDESVSLNLYCGNLLVRSEK